MSGKSRLLSEEEIRRAYSARCDRSIMGGYKNIAKAQLTKCEPLIRADERAKVLKEVGNKLLETDNNIIAKSQFVDKLRKGEMP